MQIVSMTWNYHLETPDLRPERDFRKLNKMCVKNNLFKPNDYSEFRKSNDARVTVVKGKINYGVDLPDENFRYGRPNKFNVYYFILHLQAVKSNETSYGP